MLGGMTGSVSIHFRLSKVAMKVNGDSGCNRLFFSERKTRRFGVNDDRMCISRFNEDGVYQS